MKWFGKNWGAPICASEDRVATPVGTPCLDCNEPIAEGDQGVVMPFTDVVDDVIVSRLVANHLDCFLKSVLPHGPDCERCRGLERQAHSPSCEYRTGEGEALCGCEKGRRMTQLLDPGLTLAEAMVIAEETSIDLDRMMDVMRKRRSPRNARGAP